MSTPHPKNYVAMQPGIRHAAEMFTARIQMTWCPSEDSYTVSVTVYEGAEAQDLRSEVVGPNIRALDLGTALRLAEQDLLDLERRSRNPFDDIT
jgi:hypothetical protein